MAKLPDFSILNKFEKIRLVKTNRKLSQRIYELQNIFRISLELTSILDKEKLHFTYIINIIGLMRATGAILMLPSREDNQMLRLTIQRGFRKVKQNSFAISTNVIKTLQRKNTHRIWTMNDEAAQEILKSNYIKAKNLGVELIAPLSNMSESAGLVLIGKKLNNENYTASEFELLSLINNFFATILKNVGLIEELERLSATDGLTHLFNRRAFYDYLEKEIDRCKRFDLKFSLVMIDIDHFKRYNDHNGHLAGDTLLIMFAELLRTSARSHDIIARYGGEEFAIILIGVDAEGAQVFCNRLREAIKEHPFPHRETQPLKYLSASMGIASFPLHSQEVRSLVKCADDALYVAKNSGRDRVIIYKKAAKIKRRKGYFVL